ncbi:C-type mannose receptor 2-like isoform X2 [Hemibagrus wyckioides]|nr:C-type mannose receptor 2-like isoform X2 [Hemibagrus wyckioides]
MMEKRMYSLLFFTGLVTLVQSVPHKYYLIQQGKTWSDAQAYCRVTHTDLAIVESNEDMVRLQNEAQRQQFNSSAWIGLWNDIHSWRWSLGNEPLGSETFWYFNEPNNGGGNQACAATDTRQWSDKACTDKYPVVCFDENKAGTERFIYVPNSMTWLEAQSYCRQYHTDLTSVKSLTENNIVKGLISGYSWIGLFRDSWKWTDKTNFSTVSWVTGKPDNALKVENCGYIINNQAADALCSDVKPFFCCSDITGQKQTIRVKIQSSQDVKDPAVKAMILKQIYQKLKDHEMAENSTVKWAEQRDGEVFHKKKDNNIGAGNENQQRCDL